MTAAEAQQTELERIDAWRAQALERAGYPPAAAAELAARHDIDIREATALLERGCPPEVAVRILV